MRCAINLVGVPAMIAAAAGRRGPFASHLVPRTRGGDFPRHHSLSHVPEKCLEPISAAVASSRFVPVPPVLRGEEHPRTLTSHTVWVVFSSYFTFSTISSADRVNTETAVETTTAAAERSTYVP